MPEPTSRTVHRPSDDDASWADQIIAERMYLSDARGIAYILADALCCPVSDVEDPAALPSGSTGTEKA